MLRAAGIPEWLARAVGDSPARPPGPKTVTKRSRTTNAPPVNGGSSATNGSANIVQTISQAINTAVAAATPAKGRSPVANALRNLFTSEHFRQIVEFNFLPSSPVRVGQEWKSQGDTLIGRNRVRFEATGKFPGWQQHLGTNCARVDVLGHVFSGGAPVPTNAPPQKGVLKATLWINTQLGFPVTTVLNAGAASPASTATRAQGTNVVAKSSPAKSIQQTMTLTLLDVAPIEGTRTEAEAPGQP
jgi:hypothetical protein